MWRSFHAGRWEGAAFGQFFGLNYAEQTLWRGGWRTCWLILGYLMAVAR
uniref:Uncharacterized protein n=1 Tax=Pseudomonas aeruginosa TaxID=287 RepID=A0A6C0L1J1_PSEAI|nr:hypothetical protein [Pseudomonas aeruginosa]